MADAKRGCHDEAAPAPTATTDANDCPGPLVNGVLLACPDAPHALVLWGGEASLDGRASHLSDRYSSSIFCFDVNSATWRRIASTGPQPDARAAAQAASVRNGAAAVVFGGEAQSAAARKKDCFVHYSDTWLLNVAAAAAGRTDAPLWTAVRTRRHPSARSGHRMAPLDGTRFALLFGGFHDVGKCATYLDDLWVFDATLNEWLCVESFSSGPLSRPAARSGAVFQRMSTEVGADGNTTASLLLLGGYSVQRTARGEPEGAVLRDAWLLTASVPAGASSAADIVFAWRPLRAPKLDGETSFLGASGGAPWPAADCSGRSAAALPDSSLFLCGGVADEEDAARECISGTCVSGLAVVRVSAGGRPTVSPLAPVPPPEAFCPRFSPMAASVHSADGASSVYVVGGAFEVGERQLVLDDVHVFRRAPCGSWTHAALVPLSAALRDCHLLAPAAESDSEDTDDSEGADDSSLGSDDSDSDSASQSESRDPLDPAGYASLKAFFDATSEHWAADARRLAAVAGEAGVSEKDVRMRAFAAARAAWARHEEAGALLGGDALSLGKRR